MTHITQTALTLIAIDFKYGRDVVVIHKIVWEVANLKHSALGH